MTTAHGFRPAAGSAYLRMLAVFVCMSAPALLNGQSAQTDVGEVVAFGGGSFGAGSHAFVGGSSGFAFSRNAMALIEGSYTNMGHDIVWPRPDIKSPEASHLWEFGVTVHIRIPVRDRWAPYAILGGGLLFNSFRSAVGPQGAVIGIDDFKGAFFTGAGLRYHIREDWGIRPECKVVISSRTYTRVSLGVFYVLPSNWP